jgi:hypothetical protein
MVRTAKFRYYVILYFFAPSTVIAAGRGWDSVFSELSISVIPNLIAVLISFAIIFLLLELPGIIGATGATVQLLNLRGC